MEDDFTRECLKMVVDISINGMRVVRELSDLIAERGSPEAILSDNGTEFTINAILKWSHDRQIIGDTFNLENRCKMDTLKASMGSFGTNV